MRRFIWVVAIAAVSVACGVADDGDGSVEGAWVLQSGELDGEPIPLVDGHPITMTLDGEEIRGTAACNGYSGRYTVSGDAFELEDGVAVTEMGCSPDDVMASERAYIDALLMVNTVEIIEDRLELTGDIVELVFVTDPAGIPPEGSGTTLDPDTPVSSSLDPAVMQGAWELMSGMLDGEPIPIFETHPITLTVEGDILSGRAACNQYGLDLSPDEGAPEMFSTAMACVPEEVMDSEEAYMTALQRLSAAAVEADELVLTGEGVELRFRALDPVPSGDLTGVVWVLESLVEGDILVPAEGEPATLELYSDGSALGSTGCRTFSGTYVVDGAEVILTEMAMRGQCPHRLADQDSLVVSVIGDGFGAVVEDDTLTLRSIGGQGLVYQAGN